MEGDQIRINKWLTPLSWLYGVGTEGRNALFDAGILKSRSFRIPIINVGNITVGGTGKTPHVEYLIRLLSPKYKVAVLSRGYKRKSKGYVLAQPETPVEEIGDEPWQIKQKFPHVHVAVEANRCKGIERLLADEATRDTEVILLDDAFQHRYVKPGLNILLTEYHRLITEDRLLPAGRLREKASGRYRANTVIVTKCPRTMTPIEFRVIEKKLSLMPFQSLFFSTYDYGNLKGLFKDEEKSLNQLGDTNVLLLTGIGNPKQMESDLKPHVLSVKSLPFPDHHFFSPEDIADVYRAFTQMPQPRLIITTEKDATRLQIRPDLLHEIKEQIYVLPVEVQIMRNATSKFNEKLFRYVHKNPKHRSLAQRKNHLKA